MYVYIYIYIYKHVHIYIYICMIIYSHPQEEKAATEQGQAAATSRARPCSACEHARPRMHQTCHFRRHAASVPEEGPCLRARLRETL